jgi:hypothetical protein
MIAAFSHGKVVTASAIQAKRHHNPAFIHEKTTK